MDSEEQREIRHGKARLHARASSTEDREPRTENTPELDSGDTPLEGLTASLYCGLS